MRYMGEIRNLCNYIIRWQLRNLYYPSENQGLPTLCACWFQNAQEWQFQRQAYKSMRCLKLGVWCRICLSWYAIVCLGYVARVPVQLCFNDIGLVLDVFDSGHSFSNPNVPDVPITNGFPELNLAIFLRLASWFSRSHWSYCISLSLKCTECTCLHALYTFCCRSLAALSGPCTSDPFGSFLLSGQVDGQDDFWDFRHFSCVECQKYG